MPKSMKAIEYTRFGPPEVLQLSEVPRPAPGPADVLIRVRAAAVTTADCAARTASSLMTRLAFGLTRPRNRILGTEFSGVVEGVGEAVRRFRPGDAVYAATGANFGAHAEYVVLPEEAALAAKPPNVSFEEAAAICEGALTALPFLRDHGRVQCGQTVLINGAAGAVGAMAVQLARYFGAEVAAVCGPDNVELVRSLGAARAIDYTRQDFTRDGRAYDVIFDAVGKSSYARCKPVLAERGVYLTTVPSLVSAVQTLRSACCGARKVRLAFTGLRSPQDRGRDLQFVRELVEGGHLKPVVSRAYSLEEIAEAHRYVETGHKRGGAVVAMPEP